MESRSGLEKPSFFKKGFYFLYEDRPRKYDPKAHEKHPNTVRRIL